MRGQDSSRNGAIDKAESARAAALWLDLETGTLFIFTGEDDAEAFCRQRRRATFGRGVELVCEVTDPRVVRQIQRLNAGVTP